MLSITQLAKRAGIERERETFLLRLARDDGICCNELFLGLSGLDCMIDNAVKGVLKCT